jgi:hypothetical protein
MMKGPNYSDFSIYHPSHELHGEHKILYCTPSLTPWTFTFGSTLQLQSILHAVRPKRKTENNLRPVQDQFLKWREILSVSMSPSQSWVVPAGSQAMQAHRRSCGIFLGSLGMSCKKYLPIALMSTSFITQMPLTMERPMSAIPTYYPRTIACSMPNSSEPSQ